MFYIIADNQELTAEGLKTVVADFNPERIIMVKGQSELITQLNALKKAVVFLDYTIFDITGVEKFIILTERFHEVQWILISDDLTDDIVRAVIYQTTNVSFVFKDSPISDIRTALSVVLNGQRYICQRVTEILLLAQSQSEMYNVELTPTEQEIVREIAHGLTTKEIAKKRALSIHTINTHRKNIFSKLNVNTAHDAIKYAIRAGIVNPSEFYI